VREVRAYPRPTFSPVAVYPPWPLPPSPPVAIISLVSQEIPGSAPPTTQPQCELTRSSCCCWSLLLFLLLLLLLLPSTDTPYTIVLGCRLPPNLPPTFLQGDTLKDIRAGDLVSDNRRRRALMVDQDWYRWCPYMWC
jgi:hypothetical protein